MRSLLTLFLTNKLLLSDVQSYGMFGVYASLVWGIPIFGGYIADKILGFQKSGWPFLTWRGSVARPRRTDPFSDHRWTRCSQRRPGGVA